MLGSDEKAGGGGDHGGARVDWSAGSRGPWASSPVLEELGKGSVCPSPLMIPHSGLRELCSTFSEPDDREGMPFSF